MTTTDEPDAPVHLGGYEWEPRARTSAVGLGGWGAEARSTFSAQYFLPRDYLYPTWEELANDYFLRFIFHLINGRMVESYKARIHRHLEFYDMKVSEFGINGPQKH